MHVTQIVPQNSYGMGVFSRSVPLRIQSEPLRFWKWFAGLWVARDELYYLCLVVLGVKILGFVSRSWFVVKSIHNTEMLLEVSATYPIPLMGIAKMTLLLVFRRQCKLLFSTITDEFWDFGVADHATRSQIKNRYKFVNGCLFSHLIMSTGHVVLHLMIPRVPIPEGRTRWLPILISFPFDQDQSPIYELLYILLSWNMFISVWGNAFFDLMFIYLAQHLWGQFMLLRYVLRNLDEGIMQYKGDVERFKSKRFQREMERRFAVCVNHHSLLLRFGQELKNLTSIIFGVQVFTTSTSLVLILYTVTENLEQITKSTMMLSIVFSSFMQVAIFAIQGSDIYEQSVSVAEAAYQSKWFLFNANCKRSLVLILMNSQKGIHMSGAGLITLNNEILVKIIQRIFSCITLLRSLEQQ